MWYALNEGTSMKIPLLPEKEYIIGRKDCDIVLENDKSISRRHASIKISRAAPEQSQSANRLQPRAVFTDLSRFGTLVNNATVCGSSQELCHGDVLTLGQYKAVVRVVLEPLIVTTSCLDSGAKRTLQAAVHTLGGHVVKEWEQGETTHLVMSQITVTPKAVCCLIEQRSIVTPDFFVDTLAACRDCKQLPSADSYCPELSDSQVNPLTASFQPNPARTAIFRGKKFIFLQRKVFVLLSKVIELGGGLCLLLEGRPRPPADTGELVAPGSIVLHADDRDALLPLDKSQWIAEVRAILKRHGKRMVQEAEIGYAVLFGSTESYCNPDREAGRRLFLTMSQSITSTQQPLVVDTQVVSGEGMAPVQPRTPLLNSSACAMIVVPSSVTSSVDEQLEPDCTKKRARPSSTSSPERAAKVAVPHGSPPARARLGGDASLVPGAPLTKGTAISTPVAWGSLKATATGRPLRTASAAALSSAELCQTNNGSRADAAGSSSIGCGRNGGAGGEHLAAAVAPEEKEAAAIVERATPVLHVPQACGSSSESVTSRGAVLATSVKRERSPLVRSSTTDHLGKTGKSTVAAVLDAPSLDRGAVPTIKREAVEDETATVDRPDDHRTRLHSGFGQRGAPRHQSSPGSGSSGIDATPSVPAAYPAQTSSVTPANAAVSLASGASAEVDAASSGIGGMNVIVQPLMRAAPPAVAAAAAAQPRCPVAEQNKDGLTLWNGKWVKNFKRFLKCGTSDLERLPRIIGGGDLVGAAALKRARLSDDAEYVCPLQPLAATRRGSCDDDWGDNRSVGGRDDDDVHVTAAARSRSSIRPSTTAARAFIVDDDSMDDSSQQSRIDAIFDRVAGRRAKF